MTEQSWLWGGTATGDASLSPYAREAFNRWFIGAVTNDSRSGAFILPGYLDDFLIEASDGDTVSTVTVKSGAVVIDNFVYVLTEEMYFSIPQLASALYRYDSLVLRVTRGNTPTVRLVLVNGNESSSYPPLPYEVEQDADGTWEVEVARILIDASVYTLENVKLDVYTRYMPVTPHFDPMADNLITNSELLAVSADGQVAGVLDGWHEGLSAGGSGPTPVASTPLASQTRGYSVNLLAGGYRTAREFDGTENKYITVEGTIRNNNSTTRTVVAITYLRLPTTLSTIKSSDEIGLNTEDTHTFIRTFAVPEDTQYILVSVYCTATSGNDFDIGQLIVTPGYYSATRRPFHEYIPAAEALTDTAWDGDAKSSGTTTINLAASFGGLVPRHVKAVLLNVRCRDSGSLAGTGLGITILSYTSAWTYGSVILDGIPNNYWRTEQIVAYIDEPFQQSLLTTRGFRATVAASGGSTLDAYIEIVGFIV